MKFSVITPSYAQGQYIRQTIESVLQQGWSELEHIVVDGGSKDGTVDVLRAYPHLKWISEPDEGQADALNKGLRLATGDIVGWINSDDFYVEGAFKRVAEAFEDPAVQWVIGDIALLYEASGEMVPIKSPTISWQALQRNPDIVRQPGVFFRRQLLVDSGGWNKEFFMVMDFDLWSRLVKRAQPLMLGEQLAVFRIQRDQKSGLGNLHRQRREMIRVLLREEADFGSVVRLAVRKEWQWAKGLVKTLLVRAGMLDEDALLRPLRGWRGN